MGFNSAFKGLMIFA